MHEPELQLPRQVFRSRMFGLALGPALSLCPSLVDASGGRGGAAPHPAGGAVFCFGLRAWRMARAT